MNFIKKNVLLILICVGVFLRLLDTFRNRNFLYEHTGFSSGTILAWLFAVVLILRIFNKQIVSKTPGYVFLVSGGLLISVMSVLAFGNYVTYENFIFGITQIHIDQLYNLGLFLFFVGVLSLPSSFFKTHYKKLIFSGGLLLFLLYYMYGYFPLDARHQIAKEDNLIENFQFVFLTLSGFFSLCVSMRLFKKQKMLGVIFFMLGLGLLFTACDEISWAQRIFNVASPEYFLKTNAQAETTLHNQKIVHGLTPIAFALVGAYGAFASVFVKTYSQYFKINRNLMVLVPQTYLFPYFFAGFFYNFYTLLGDHTIGNWSEPTELMLYLGVFLYVFVIYKSYKK